MHVFRLPDQGVTPLVRVKIFGRNVGRRNELPAQGLDRLQDEAEQVDAAGVIGIEAFRVPRVALQLPLDAFPVISRPEGDPPLLDDLIHPRRQLQLGLLADVRAADDQPDAVRAVEADAHVRLELRAALPQQERRLVVVVAGKIDRTADLPPVGFKRPDERRDEVPGLDGVVAVGPPRTASEFELRRAVVLLLLVDLEVPELVGALANDRDQVCGDVKHSETVVPGKDDGAVAVLVELEVGTPLIEEGIGGAAEVDVGGEPPFVRGQNSCQFKDDESSLNGGFAGIEDSLKIIIYY